MLLGKNCQRSTKEKNVSNNGDEIKFFHWINSSPCLVMFFFFLNRYNHKESLHVKRRRGLQKEEEEELMELRKR